MPLTPPSAPGTPPAGPTKKTTEKKAIGAPPRNAVSLPGAGSVFGRGFVARLRESGAGCMLLIFIGVGVAIFSFGLAGTVGPYKESLRSNGDPRFFLAMMAFGTVFALVATRMLQVVLTGAEQELARKRLQGKKGPPWTWDYPWRPQGMPPDYVVGSGGLVLGPVAFLAFIGLFNIAWGSPSWFLKGLVLLFDLFGLLVLYDILRALVQWLRFSHPTIAWKTFPAFLGERLEATVRFPRALHPNGPVQVTLRCVEDEWNVRQRQNGQERQLEAMAIYSEEHELPLPDGPLRQLDLALDLPTGQPGTDLAKQEATYWQLVLRVPTVGPDFDTLFLAPVYRKG